MGCAQSLSEIFTLAKERSSELQQHYQLMLAEEQRILQARASLKPNVNLEARFGQTFERIESQTTEANTNQPVSNSSSTPTLGN